MTQGISRKAFLASSAAAAGVLSAEGPVASAPLQPLASSPPRDRRMRAYQMKIDAARSHLEPSSPNVSNGDEQRYVDKRASFTKTLPHNDLGEVDPAAFSTFVSTIERGDYNGFESLPRDSQAAVGLNDPQAMYAFDLVAADSHSTHTDPAPQFESERTGVDLAELYWHGLTLDVPLIAFENDRLIAAAVADLNAFAEPLSPRLNAPLTPGSLFRSSLPGALNGPPVSQFLLHDIPYGLATIVQRYRFPVPGQTFLTNYASWLACQRGAKPLDKLAFLSEDRWIATHRDLTEFVHRDFSFQSYMNAALIALQFGPEALSPTNPYRKSTRDFGDITFGNKMALTMLAQAALLGQKASYYHKWMVHRRARPEVIGGRLENQLSGRKDYGLRGDLLRSEAVARTKANHKTALLPQAYPEGSPTHPSYPSAHAANAGACVTVLKALFNEEFVIPNAVIANTGGSSLQAWKGNALTLGGEFDKLGSNIAFARHASGVHYRADSVAGMLLGEAQALGLLTDYSRTFSERFDGFVLTSFQGKKLRVRDGQVIDA